MSNIRSVCVYCGSSRRVAQAYRDAATDLGTLLAKARVELVYGGGHVGLMGLMADAATAAGGRVLGVIPEHLERREVGHRGISELVITDSMHSRKLTMAQRSDGFAILPGGLGTLDETFEILTWKQLGLHSKPIVIVDIDGYWAPLLALLEQVVDAGFAGADTRDLYAVVDSVEAVLPALEAAPPPKVDMLRDKWA